MNLTTGTALFAASALSATMVAPAFAQDAQEEAGDAGSGNDIIVTAQRIEQRLQDVPVSITVLSQSTRSSNNVANAKDLVSYTPGLTVNNRYGADNTVFAVRGFTQDQRTTATVGTYFADVVMPRGSGATFGGDGAGPGSLFDLQNVQVLKGPQGTLFGRNSTGGAVLLVPVKPKDRTEGYFEGSAGNGTLASAKTLARPSGSAGTEAIAVVADVGGPADCDFYKYTTAATNPNGLTVNLNASGRSLLQAKVTVFGPDGNVLATATAAAPGQDLTVNLPSVAAGTAYFVKVEAAAGTAFGTGAYRLVTGDPRAAVVTEKTTPKPVNDGGTNNTLAAATVLAPLSNYGGALHYETVAQLGSKDVDYYRVTAATPADGEANLLTVAVRSTDAGKPPRFTVYDANGAAVPVVTLMDDAGTYSVRVEDAAPGAVYHVAVSGGKVATNYTFSADARSVAGRPKVLNQGTLTDASRTARQSIWFEQTGLTELTLSTAGGGGSVTLTITGIWGETIATLTAKAGETVSSIVLLNSGLYFLNYEASGSGSGGLTTLDYTLSSLSLSDPIGVGMKTTTLNSAGTGTTSGTTGSGTSSTDPNYYAWLGYAL